MLEVTLDRRDVTTVHQARAELGSLSVELSDVDRLTDLRPGQMSNIEAALNQLLAIAPSNPTKQQRIQAKKRIRRTITEYLDPTPIEQLKAIRRNGDKDALDRIIDKSTPNGQ